MLDREGVMMIWAESLPRAGRLQYIVITCSVGIYCEVIHPSVYDACGLIFVIDDVGCEKGRPVWVLPHGVYCFNVSQFCLKR